LLYRQICNAGKMGFRFLQIGIREQAALSTDPVVLSQRIDEIAATLGGTAQWIRDQQQIFGGMEDLLLDTAAPGATSRARETE
jgi:hypothetical protein